MVRESASGVSEGSHIIKRGRYYYLFAAEGGTESGHCEWVMRSDQGPFGPYELGPQNPLWRNGVEDEIHRLDRHPVMSQHPSLACDQLKMVIPGAMMGMLPQ